MERSRAKELQEDFRCHQSHPEKILKGNKMENQAAGLYTRRIFKMFQDELIGSRLVAIKEITIDGSVLSNRLVDDEKERERTTTHDHANGKCTLQLQLV